MGHPDFRIDNRIFASLFEREGRTWGMVKLSPRQQKQFVADHAALFDSIRNRDGRIGAWGKQGCTQVTLDALTGKSAHVVVRRAMIAACRNLQSE